MSLPTKTGLLTTRALAAVAVAVLAGCSTETPPPAQPLPSNSSRQVPMSPATGPATRVVVDGQIWTMTEPVSCSSTPDGAAPGTTTISVTRSAPIPAYAPEASVQVELSAGSEPVVVTSVGIRFSPSTNLAYGTPANPTGDATATKTGKSYTITGHAMDTVVPVDQRVLKAFQIDVTCP